MADRRGSRPQTACGRARAGAGWRRYFVSIPHRHLARLGRLLGSLAYGLDGIHRRIVHSNLRFVYPDWTEGQVRDLSRRVFQNISLTFLELFQMAFYTRADFRARVRVRGKEHLIEASRSPHGAVIVSAHLGNWEMAFLAGSGYLEKPCAAIARRIRPRMLDSWLRRFRSRLGGTVIDKRGALPKMVRILRAGGALGILIDQETIRVEGVEVSFLGRRATATPAAALLARRYRVPVLPAFCLREDDEALTLTVRPPLALRRSEDSGADLQANTQAMTDAVEEVVRAYPEQWFWFHRRWKRHYPTLYPGHVAKRMGRLTRKRAGIADYR
jgi:Kdo2-lipid IVA lauroyltransferase/acyltransferase